MNEKEAIERVEKYIKSFNGNALDCVAIGTVLTLLEKKNKIIDLMAYNIAANDSNLCQYIDETIRCKKYAGENKLTCDECIKQYFERKAENGN